MVTLLKEYLISDSSCESIAAQAIIKCNIQVTLTLLLSVKADGMGEQIQWLESKLANMKEKITQLKDLDPVGHGQSSTAKINSQIYPSKTEAEIKAHLESILVLELTCTLGVLY